MTIRHDRRPAARVVRTFAFVDVCGFTEVADTAGDAAAVALLQRFRHAVRSSVSRSGARVGKWLGDGAMIVGVEAPLVVTAVLDVAEEMSASRSRRPVRTGVATGEVIVFEGDDYIGRVVNLAARLCDLAAPGSVLATEAVPRPPGVVATEPRTLVVAGIASPVEVTSLSRRVVRHAPARVTSA